MSLIVTGADILERIRRDIKTPSNAGNYGDVAIARYWEEEWSFDWTELGAGDYGIGLKRTTFTAVGSTHAVAADFLYMLAITRERSEQHRQPGTYTSDKMVNAEGLYLATTWQGGDWYYQLLTGATGDTLEVMPPLDGSETIRMSYCEQPPSLGDPTNQPVWQVASINVIAEPIYAHAIARARVRAVSRESQAEYQRALTEQAERRARFLEQRRARLMASGVSASRLISTRSGWSGYGYGR